jgi:hypothetical protein
MVGILMRKTIFLLLTGIALTPIQVNAESIREIIAKYNLCVNQETAKIEAPKTINAYTDRGCVTGYTSFDGAQKSCEEDICWEAPPTQTIIDSRVWDFTSYGSSHSYDATRYLPDRQTATRVCNVVRAVSPKGIDAGRGCQKLSLDVTLQHTATASERSAIASQCEKQVAGG